MQPELIADYRCETGEGPLWHPTEKLVYWTDIPAGRVFRYDPATGMHEICYTGEVVGGFTVQADGSLLFFMERGAVKIWRDGALTTVIGEISDERETRFNDVIADPEGRVFCGTMPTHERPGRLYRLDTDGTLHLILEDVGISNGMGFTSDHRTMYFTDTPTLNIYRFDYDRKTGGISNREVFARATAGEGMPDGMTVDADGFIWSARWDGHCLVRYTPQGVEERRIRFPVRKVSSLTFGGGDCTDIYVTTAGGNIRHEDGEHAGALFRLNLGIRGVPEFYSRIGL